MIFWNLKNAQDQSGENGSLANTGLVGLSNLPDLPDPVNININQIMQSGNGISRELAREMVAKENIERKANIKKFVMLQKERKGQVASNTSNFGLTRMKIE